MATAKAEPSARIANNSGPYVASTGSAVNGLSTESIGEATTDGLPGAVAVGQDMGVGPQERVGIVAHARRHDVQGDAVAQSQRDRGVA